MSNLFGPAVDFDPAAIGDAALAELRQLTVRRVLPDAGEFGTWLHRWCDAEQARRQRGARNLVKHDLALPPAPEWSDAQVADALAAVTTLSYSVTDSAIGQMVDRLVLVIADEAAARLKAKGGVAQ
jgi:hypothetical protein